MKEGKDLEGKGSATATLALCEVCGERCLFCDPDRYVVSGGESEYVDAVARHWRLGYERLLRDRAAPAAPSSPSDLSARETKDNQELTKALRAASLSQAQAMVLDFHKALGVVIGDSPRVRSGELRASLIEEEAKETADALRAGNLTEAIDGMCDVIYVALGAAIECGVDLSPFFAEVHRSNMAKAGGPTRADGKVLKPPGWRPPDIAGVLALTSGASATDRSPPKDTE